MREGRLIARQDDGTWASTQAINEILIPSSVIELTQAAWKSAELGRVVRVAELA